MKSNERQPGSGPCTGAYIGSLIIRRPEAITAALKNFARMPRPVDEMPMENVELVRAISNEAGYMLSEGDDASERREVFWRGIYFAYALAWATKPVGLPRLRDGRSGGLEYTADFQDVMPDVYAMQANIPLSTEISELGHTIIDKYGGYTETAKLGVLTGLYLLDNGEREKRAEYEAQCAQANKELVRNQFARITGMLETREWDEIIRHYDDPMPSHLTEDQ